MEVQSDCAVEQLLQEERKAEIAKGEPSALSALLDRHRMGDKSVFSDIISECQYLTFAASRKFIRMMRKRYQLNYVLEELIGAAHTAA